MELPRARWAGLMELARLARRRGMHGGLGGSWEQSAHYIIARVVRSAFLVFVDTVTPRTTAFRCAMWSPHRTVRCLLFAVSYQ